MVSGDLEHGFGLADWLFYLLWEKEALSFPSHYQSILEGQTVLISATFQTLLPRAGIYLPEILYAFPDAQV